MTDWEVQRMSFGAGAATYQASRPDWPAPTAAWLTGTDGAGPLRERAASSGGLDVLDLGAGTGKLTRTLVAAGHRVHAVDPSEGMLAELSAALPQVDAQLGTAERIPLPAASVDVVTVAQAWHWVDPHVAALECARVLRPGGLLAIAWHRRLSTESSGYAAPDPDGAPTPSWVVELNALVDAPRSRSQRTVRAHRDEIVLPLEAGFGALEFATFKYDHYLLAADLPALTSTWSYVATRPDAERERILAAVAALGRRVTAGSPDGMLHIPHVTYCYRAARQP